MAFTILLLAASAQAQFIQNTTDVPAAGPANSSTTDNVDFGDVDLDGDWDAVFADGGEQGPDQNRIWINRGPGANLGVFVDETGARFPAVSDQSRDLEFVDFDGDGDLDLYVANTSLLLAQTGRWWANGGVGSGVYVDETQARWVNLGGTGSSIPAAAVFPTGGFIDFSGDADFADLDNDGDLDLFHSSHGANFVGGTPSRIFLNDGGGFFEEFNPSGVQLQQQTIQDGQPGLWCEGLQLADTLDSTGTTCDVATSAPDVELADVDGDFDVDVLLGARDEAPRLFTNRTVENGGALGFRDTTGASFVGGYATGFGHYEQEMGDMDGDGDLDLVGVNWFGPGFSDSTLENDGAGFFGAVTALPSSSLDDTEADFLDYDNDGDLDLVFASWSGDDRLYRNDQVAGGPASFTLASFPASPLASGDVQVADVDGDGDYDLFTGMLFGQPNRYFENVSQVPDVHAPYLPRVEQAPDRAPGAQPTVVRAHVYDNAPTYATAYNSTQLVYSVNFGVEVAVPAAYAGGQVVRAEIPGQLVGLVQYRFESQDAHGNAGASATRQFTASVASSGSGFCFGDGSGAACPCGASGAPRAGCPNSVGAGAVLVGSGVASVSTDTFQLSASGLGGPCLLLRGANQVGGGAGAPVGEGLLCAAGQSLRSQVQFPLLGATTFSDFQGAPFGASAFLGGQPTNYQAWYRDPVNSCNGGGFNFSNGWTVLWLP